MSLPSARRADRNEESNRDILSVKLSRQGAAFGRDSPAFLLPLAQILPGSDRSTIKGVPLRFRIRGPVPSSTWINTASHTEDILNNYH
jgi:hypothetical protein